MANALKLLVLNYLPTLAKRAFAFRRTKEDKSYWTEFAIPSHHDKAAKSINGRTRLLLVLPADFEEVAPFEPASGNYYYEIFRSAQERFGVQFSDLYFLDKYKDWAEECRSIVSTAHSKKISHLMFNIESTDYRLRLWRWDILAAELKRSGSSVTAIGLLTDGTYQLHQVQCSRFNDVYDNSLFVQIDVKPSSKYVRKGRLVGPTFLPISIETIDRLEEHFLKSGSDPEYELSFIGKLYGYREKIIGKLVENGLPIVTNPQVGKDPDKKASYIEYMGALRKSKYTINFARANGTKQRQLKSRMLESALAGSIAFTDDGGLSAKILPNGLYFRSFRGPNELARVFGNGFHERINGVEVGDNLKLVAEELKQLACSHFWRTLEEGLSEASLMSLRGFSPSPRESNPSVS